MKMTTISVIASMDRMQLTSNREQPNKFVLTELIYSLEFLNCPFTIFPFVLKTQPRAMYIQNKLRVNKNQ